jgi:sulfite exporter TauE/SafE
MKGSYLLMTILKYLIIALGILMVVMGLYNSWSEHVVDDRYRALLNALLWSASVFYMVSSYVLTNRKKVLSKFLGMNIRFGQALRITSFMFLGILLSELENYTVVLWLPLDTWHYIFTGLAIVSAYITWLFEADTRYHRRNSYIGLAFGAITFLAAFIFDLYSVGLGEVLVTVPLFLYMTYQYRKHADNTL